MDTVCIQMPKSPREFFLAMPVVQDYLFGYIQEVKRGSRDSKFDITLRMDEVYSEYELPLKVAKDISPSFDYTGWTVKNRSEFACFIDFDFEAAVRISSVTRKHITESLGLLIGSTPRKWPLITPPRCSQGKGILILNWNDDGDDNRMYEQGTKLQKCFKDAHLVSLKDYDMAAINMLDIDTCEGVIGPASVVTHLAASYNRPVLEIFPDVTSYHMYNNEGIPTYQALIARPKDINAELVLSAWNNMQQLDNFEVTNYEQILD